MIYVIVAVCVLAVTILVVRLFLKKKKAPGSLDAGTVVSSLTEKIPGEQDDQSVVIQMEMLPVESISDESQLVEITDSRVLAHINNLIPGMAQAGNAVNNAAQATRGAGEVLYRAIIPAGSKLTDSRAVEGAVRGIYHGADGIKGHANLVAVEPPKGTAVMANTAAAAMGVASMVVGQYYMAQIHAELGAISDGISKISDFQDNEYRSRVFSLVAHVKRIADYQVEILENDELRLSKISQLDSLEEDCTQLLGQANLTLAGFAKRTDLNYEKYERALGAAQNWFAYQKSLLDLLCKISELRYTLHLGAVSREQCAALLPTYTKQVNDTQERLSGWHQDTTKRLSIDTAEARRKREGIDGVVHFLPGLFNDDFNFRAIEKSTAKMIDAQAAGNDYLHHQDITDLYAEDVHIIAKDGKIYYFPEKES